MTKTYFFQYNLPAENHLSNKPDYFIDVVVKCEPHFYYDKTPLIQVMPVNLNHKVDLIMVKNWLQAFNEMEAIAKAHFCGLDNAKVLSSSESDLLIQKNLS